VQHIEGQKQQFVHHIWGKKSKTERKTGTSRHRRSRGHKLPEGAEKASKGLFDCFCTIFRVKNSETTLFDSTSANEGLKNNSTTRKHPGRSHHRGTRGHKWPERAKKERKGLKRPFWLFLHHI
jgi:hypothetical protein